MEEAQFLADRVAVMRGGQIIASGRPDELGGRDLRPAEIRFELPEGLGLDDVPEVPADTRSLEGDRVVIQTRQPIRAAQIVTAWSLEADIDLAHFSVTQPSLEDIYLELTGTGTGAGPSDDATAGSRGGCGMNPVPQSTLGRDLGLVLWQIRYEQRAYWRNRGRGIFTFVFPVMFLVIFASLDKGQTISSRGNIAFDDFYVPGILAYGIIATTFVNLAIGTAILRDQGILKRMQGTPLPRWAYVLARIGSASIVMLGMTVLVLVLGAALWGVQLPGRSAAGADRLPAAGHGVFHDDRDRDHPVHPQR